ncbi:low affinity iron permease family protein [Flavihumibacter sp. R14]|nr:low affinity iron permease family protein [Flavihumibacter soli]
MKKKHNFFERFANKMTAFAGSSVAFSAAFLIVLLWAATGPLFGYSSTWQLVINTGTTIITFLMVFLIQKSQNKDSKAIQLKLNELIAASEKASNRMVDIEDLSEEELDNLYKFYRKLSKLAAKENDIHQSHSIDAAHMLHELKKVKSQNQRRPVNVPVTKSKGPSGNNKNAKADNNQ